MCRRSTAAFENYPTSAADEDGSDTSASSSGPVQRPRARTVHGGDCAADSEEPVSAAHAAQGVLADEDEPAAPAHAANAEGHPDTLHTQHTSPPDPAACCVQPAGHSRAQMRVVRTLLSSFLDPAAAQGERGCGGRRRRPLRRAVTVAASNRAGLVREMQRLDSTRGASAALEFHRRAQLDDELYECKAWPACCACFVSG